MLVLFHDVVDPASAVAVARFTRLADEGLPIGFEGFETGVDVALPTDLSVLAALDEVAGAAADEGLVLRRPVVSPPTGLCHVLLEAAETTAAAAAVRLGVYRAHWEQGRDVADRAVLRDVAVTAGMDGSVVDVLLADRLALATRRRRMASFRRDGVGGVPVVLASRTLLPGLLDESQIRDLAARV